MITIYDKLLKINSEKYIEKSRYEKPKIKQIILNNNPMKNRNLYDRNLEAMRAKIQMAKRAVQQQYPVKDFVILLDEIEELRQRVDDAIQREPMDGHELNKVR